MPGPLPRSLSAILLLFPAWAAASAAPGLRFLVRSETLCDADRVLCLEASVTWEPNERLIQLYGTVQATARPGDFVLVFRGHMRDGVVRYTEMRVPLDGKYSEIARRKMIPDWPEIDDWAFDHARFEPRATRP
jgi:hypothetical protein